MFYIYKITNLINNKLYIGYTKNLEKRWKQHLHIASTKKKDLYHYIHKSINKYGSNNFIIEQIEECESKQIAIEREKYWIAYFKSTNQSIGYNLTFGGEGSSGLKWTEESKKKVRGENNPRFGKPLSNETKEKLSKIFSGENNPFYGKKHSKETVEFLKNRKVSDET